MKRSKFQGDDKILAQNLARKIEKGNPRRSIGVQDTITTEQQMGAGYPKINRITQEGTQTNVAGGDVRYRKQMGGGRSGKESSYVSLQRQAGGGDVGRVGVSTFGGQMKFKGAEVSPEGEITTRFRNPFRAKRAKKAIAATPAFKKN